MVDATWRNLQLECIISYQIAPGRSGSSTRPVHAPGTGLVDDFLSKGVIAEHKTLRGKTAHGPGHRRRGDAVQVPYRAVGLTRGWAAGPGEKRKISGCLPGMVTSRRFPPEALVEG